MQFRQVYNVYPTLARSDFFTSDNKGLYGINSSNNYDIDIYKKLCIYHYKKDKINDLNYSSKYIINKYKIELPDFIKLLPLNYEVWKKVNNDIFSIKNITTILNNCIEECYIINKEEKIEKVNLIKIIKKRPLFWKSLLDIINHISELNFNVDQKEKELAKKVRTAQKHYQTTLDGIYDIFVFQNFPDHFMWYKSLDNDSKIDILGFYQAVTGVNVEQSLNLFRTGKVKSVILKPGSNADKKALEEKLNESEAQVLSQSKEELEAAIRRDKSSNKKIKINTASENSEFMSPEV